MPAAPRMFDQDLRCCNCEAAFVRTYRFGDRVLGSEAECSRCGFSARVTDRQSRQAVAHLHLGPSGADGDDG